MSFHRGILAGIFFSTGSVGQGVGRNRRTEIKFPGFSDRRMKTVIFMTRKEIKKTFISVSGDNTRRWMSLNLTGHAKDALYQISRPF